MYSQLVFNLADLALALGFALFYLYFVWIVFPAEKNLGEIMYFAQ